MKPCEYLRVRGRLISNTIRQQILDPATGDLLHEIIRPVSAGSRVSALHREDFSNPVEFLQGALIEIPAGHSFAPHVHLERERSFSNLRAQETWIVMSGQVEVTYYTDGGIFIAKEVINAGEVSITFRGGHGYRTLSSDARVYEFKSGPYEGQEIDKAFIKTT
jgi:hypothetical protein